MLVGSFYLTEQTCIVFIDTDGLGNGFEDIGPINRVESVITTKLALALSAAGLDESSIGIHTEQTCRFH
jgi:hypothetical protein